MIDPVLFANACRSAGFEQVVGIPDSLLKHGTAALAEEYKNDFRVMANEGSAIGFAIGSYSALKKPALVYLQNSGIGNALNPLVSLASGQVLGCPLVLLIGWRGEVDSDGQILDEPQHLLQGQVTLPLLELLGIPYLILDKDSDSSQIMLAAKNMSQDARGPVAVVVRKASFNKFTQSDAGINEDPRMSRELAISKMLEICPDSVPILAATGMIGREVLKLSEAAGRPASQNLLVIGGMGHASSIATGLASSRVGEKIICVDGDGGCLMHLGSLASLSERPEAIYVVLNNEVHDSVGGQSSLAPRVDFKGVAAGLGFKHVKTVSNPDEIKSSLSDALESNSSSFLEIVCAPGHSGNLPRPPRSPSEDFVDFSDFVAVSHRRMAGD